jgi:hypothetical protein
MPLPELKAADGFCYTDRSSPGGSLKMKRFSVLLPLVSISCFAGTIYNGGTGAIVFGVAPYGGAPNVGGPTYIADNFTGQNDILSSPGLGTLGGYLTASPVIANNIFSLGPAALPFGATQNGGGNGAGAFGSGAAYDGGSFATFALADSGPGGGSASYLIVGGDTTYTVVGAPLAAGTSYGSYIAIGGSVPLVGNADVASLRVHLSDTAGVFGAGGTDEPQEVLAISRNGAGAGIGNYNIVTIGGVAGGNAGLILDNGVTGAFRALAVDNSALGAPLPVGDVISVEWTLTAYSDPASFDSIDPTLQTDLLNLTGPLPGDAFIGVNDTSVTPEPGMPLLMGGGLVAIWLYRRSSRQKPVA